MRKIEQLLRHHNISNFKFIKNVLVSNDKMLTGLNILQLVYSHNI